MRCMVVGRELIYWMSALWETTSYRFYKKEEEPNFSQNSLIIDAVCQYLENNFWAVHCAQFEAHLITVAGYTLFCRTLN